MMGQLHRSCVGLHGFTPPVKKCSSVQEIGDGYIDGAMVLMVMAMLMVVMMAKMVLAMVMMMVVTMFMVLIVKMVIPGHSQ